MYFSIENEFLSVQVSDLGAELHSLVTKIDGYEYIWQGDPNIWSGQSPILFPIVGRLQNDSYTLDGKLFSLPKHGFARRSMFKLTEKHEDLLVFSLFGNDETLSAYPFIFELRVSFQIEETALNIVYSIINLNDRDMFFSLGAHPAFNCRIGDYIEFEYPETVFSECVDKEGLIIPEKRLVLENSKILEITDDIFINDALILSGLKSRFITLKSNKTNKTVKVTLGGAPFLGLWAKPGASFVCIEPWYGIADSHKNNFDFSQKRGIVMLEMGGKFDFSCNIIT